MPETRRWSVDRGVDALIGGRSFLEGLRWHDGRLYASDVPAHEVIEISADGEVRVVCEIPHQPSGLGWTPGGEMLIVSMLDRQLMRLTTDGELVVHTDVSHLEHWMINDMHVDASGRAYISTVGFDFSSEPLAPTTIIRVDLDGTATVAADGLFIPNGLKSLPGGTRMVVSETMGNRLVGYDVDAAGNLTNGTDWARFAPRLDSTDVSVHMQSAAVLPDGLEVDSEGAVWVADTVRGRVLRVLEGGSITDEVTVPGSAVVACALGGDDGTTLFIAAVAQSDLAGHNRGTSAAIVTTRVEVPA